MQHTNRLANESSPYLLQHAHNPVDWFPWSDEAFEKARAEDKPVLVSIGYAACHWCHVMERESFEDEQTAAFMNEHFVNIKVDREERPDVDHIYMDAVQAIAQTYKEGREKILQDAETLTQHLQQSNAFGNLGKSQDGIDVSKIDDAF